MCHDQTDYHWRVDRAVSLCHALLPHDSSLAAEVRLAITQPISYVSEFQDRLADRGIFEAIPVLPWIAFLDGLVAREQLAQVDWRDDTTMVLHKLDRVLPPQLLKPNRWVWVHQATWDKTTTLDFLMAIGAKLSEQDFVLADCQSATFASDSYAVMVIHKARFTVAQQLMREFGQSDMIPCLKDGLSGVER